MTLLIATPSFSWTLVKFVAAVKGAPGFVSLTVVPLSPAEISISAENAMGFIPVSLAL